MIASYTDAIIIVINITIVSYMDDDFDVGCNVHTSAIYHTANFLPTNEITDKANLGVGCKDQVESESE